MENNEDVAIEAINKVSKKVESFQTKLGDKLDKEEFETVKAQISTLEKGFKTMDDAKIGETVKSINEAIAKFQTQMEEMQEDVSKAKDHARAFGVRKSLGQIVVDALQEKKLLDTPLRKGEHRTLELDVNKIVGTMTTGNVTASVTDAIPFTLSDNESGLTRIVNRQPWLLQIANVSGTTGKFVQWAEQANREGAADETAEGSLKNQIDFDWVEKSARVEKITAYIKVSKEALSDVPTLKNEIDTELTEMVLLQADTDILSGDGTTPTLNGLLNQDTAYAAGSFAGTVSDPNKSDVLRTAVAQVVAAHFRPNYILMHPDDVASMDLEKGTDGHYTLPPFKSADGLSISGVRILENTGQTVDKFTVGDFSKLNIKMREGFTIDIGLENDDFTRNLVTILGEIRLAVYVKTNHAGAFVSGDFSDAIAALDSGS